MPRISPHLPTSPRRRNETPEGNYQKSRNRRLPEGGYHTGEAPPTGASRETARGMLRPPKAAKVTISAEPRQLASAASSNDANTQKIEAIRAAINEGTLRIDAHVVAEKMVPAAGE